MEGYPACFPRCSNPRAVRFIGRNIFGEKFKILVNLVPRLFVWGKKNPGRSWSRDHYKINCLRGYGQSIKLHMLPLPDFTLRLQGVSVLSNRL